MAKQKRVRVFAPPVAACGGGENPWAIAAESVFKRLRLRFPGVTFEFLEYFSPEFFEATNVVKGLQAGTLQPPIVVVGDEILPSRGKISEQAIRGFLETRA